MTSFRDISHICDCEDLYRFQYTYRRLIILHQLCFRKLCIYAPSPYTMESTYIMVHCLVGTENLSDFRGRGCPYLPSEEKHFPCFSREERLPHAGEE